MKRWRFETLLLLAILSTCLVTVSTNDENDDDDDGVTIESEKVVSFNFFSLIHLQKHSISIREYIKCMCIIACLGISKAST